MNKIKEYQNKNESTKEEHESRRRAEQKRQQQKTSSLHTSHHEAKIPFIFDPKRVVFGLTRQDEKKGKKGRKYTRTQFTHDALSGHVHKTAIAFCVKKEIMKEKPEIIDLWSVIKHPFFYVPTPTILLLSNEYFGMYHLMKDESERKKRRKTQKGNGFMVG
ncbi:CLUMA_CG013505, isoform A [Clunio marinus]|uniref:CLUMA_CG013505, isoform A n=1 Tax=Clunio marinus TaxID=568069 RepID=A0A1J1IJ53_9DIPT|nr:CLUMA_CG013505, isoform A [Clunio marinus]